jgi:hypothetical protein
MKRITIAAALLIASASTLDAQACQGRPYFSTGKYQLGASFETGNNISYIGGEFALGSDRSAFGRITLGRESIDIGRNDASGLAVGGAIGYQFADGNLQLCPIISGRRASLDLPGDNSLTRGQIQLGLNVGLNRRTNSDPHFVPFAGLAFAQLSRDIEDEDDGDELSLGTETYFPLTAGLGLHFGSSFMFIGDVTIPIDLGDSDPIFGFRIVFPMGGR